MRCCSLLQHKFEIYADKTRVFLPKTLTQYSLKDTDGEKKTATVAADFTNEVTEGWINEKLKLPEEIECNTTFHIPISPYMNEVQ